MDTVDINKLEAGREMDALVAERVMGLVIYDRAWPCGYDPECGYYEPSLSKSEPASWHDEFGPVIADEIQPDGDEFKFVKPVPFYSTKIEHAWEVVIQLERKGWWWDASNVQPNSDEIVYEWTFRPDSRAFYACEFTLPLAICKAALKATQQ